MRELYIRYPDRNLLSDSLTWSHYLALMTVCDNDARSFYEKESKESRWSVDELRREIDTSLFERLLLSDGRPNKEKVLALAQRGVDRHEPSSVLKQPFVFEFLGNRENRPIFEDELEQRLIRHIEDFLLDYTEKFIKPRIFFCPS